MRTIRYRAIADDLRSRVRDGEFGAGRLLPSESAFSDHYSASRVTVRRALELLRDDGLLDARQGLGWFVATSPVRQTLGRLATIEGQMEESGLHPERRILDFAFVAAPPFVAEVLGSARVLEVRRLNLADGEPFALVTVWCPEVLAADLSRASVERSPFYELLTVALGGATQTIGATAADAADAALLAVPVGSPILRCQRVTRDCLGAPVLVSVHLFPAHRTEFVVDLVQSEPSIAPSGLRLVD